MRISTTTPAYQSIEVDLWGTVFETIDLPKSKQRKMREVQAKIDAIEDGGDDEKADDTAIESYGALLDLFLVSTNGQRTKPSTLLKRAWEADKTTPFELGVLIAKLRAAQNKMAGDAIEAFLEQRPT